MDETGMKSYLGLDTLIHSQIAVKREIQFSTVRQTNHMEDTLTCRNK